MAAIFEGGSSRGRNKKKRVTYAQRPAHIRGISFLTAPRGFGASAAAQWRRRVWGQRGSGPRSPVVGEPGNLPGPLFPHLYNGGSVAYCGKEYTEHPRPRRCSQVKRLISQASSRARRAIWTGSVSLQLMTLERTAGLERDDGVTAVTPHPLLGLRLGGLWLLGSPVTSEARLHPVTSKLRQVGKHERVTKDLRPRK